MAYLAPSPYAQAVRGGLSLTYTVDALLGGSPISGAQGLQPTGGTITDTSKPGVRRTLNLELAPEPGLFDLLAPVGVTLKVTAHVMFSGRTSVDIPMGVFDVDSQKITEGGGSISLTAPDKWVRIQRAKFLWPTGPQASIKVTDQLSYLIRDALGQSEPVAITASSQSLTAPVVWEKDRDKAITDLAAGIGAWVYFDRNGLATVADLPTIGPTADWVVDASANGVLTDLDRSRARANAFNVVVVTSTASGGPAFPVQYVWDTDSSSGTFAGTDPPSAANVGPFGIVPYFHDTPLPLSVPEAREVGLTILSRTTGVASSVSLGQVPNPAVDAGDVLDVLGPKERYDLPRGFDRHMAETVTHPLTLGTAQHIDGRSTRTDDYA